jgi:hypothetical protein
MRLSRAVAEELSNEGETLDEVVIAALLRTSARPGAERSGQRQQPSDVQVRDQGTWRAMRPARARRLSLKVLGRISATITNDTTGGLSGRSSRARDPLAPHPRSRASSHRSPTGHRPAFQESFEELIRAGSQFDPKSKPFIRVMEKKSPTRASATGSDSRRDPNEDYRNLLSSA